jgi:hypothetical protein
MPSITSPTTMPLIRHGELRPGQRLRFGGANALIAYFAVRSDAGKAGPAHGRQDLWISQSEGCHHWLAHALTKFQIKRRPFSQWPLFHRVQSGGGSVGISSALTKTPSDRKAIRCRGKIWFQRQKRMGGVISALRQSPRCDCPYGFAPDGPHQERR